MGNPAIYINSSKKNRNINDKIISQLKRLKFKVLYPLKLTNQRQEKLRIFRSNLRLIKRADLMVVVLRGYGKDTAAEVGIAFGLGKDIIGIDFDADPKDVMVYNALTAVVKPENLSKVLVKYLTQDEAKNQ
jgi:nucleoside 2-deoxyribosyltransferase